MGASCADDYYVKENKSFHCLGFQLLSESPIAAWETQEITSELSFVLSLSILCCYLKNVSLLFVMRKKLCCVGIHTGRSFSE